MKYFSPIISIACGLLTLLNAATGAPLWVIAALGFCGWLCAFCAEMRIILLEERESTRREAMLDAAPPLKSEIANPKS